MKKITCNLLCITSFTFILLSLSAATEKHAFSSSDTSKKSFKLFEEDQILEITLRFDLATYFRTKPKEEYLKANLTIHTGENDSISRDIRLRTRGEYRNANCTYPPIELNLKKVEFGFSDLDKIGKIKIVNQCGTGIDNQEYVLREFLVYKMFSVLTDTSFRVRLLKINFIDTEKKRKLITHYGFFIEPVEILAQRINCLEVKSTRLNQKHIYPFIMDRLAIFNYMIGNYDYSIPGQHNVRVFKPNLLDDRQLGLAIPYDFDWTGMVDASYAVPAEVIGTKHIQERLFRGICRTKEVYRNALKVFITEKDEFYKVINDFQHLSPRTKKSMTKYLDEFYQQINEKEDIIDIFINSCKDF